MNFNSGNCSIKRHWRGRLGVIALKSCSPHTSWLSALIACAAAILLAGCETDRTVARALQPLSPQILAELEQRHMLIDSPILIRLFKEESEIEVWKQDTSGHFALLKTYPICRWSGELGPKTREGDRQAPEGFYTVRPGQLNPNSHHYLSFDIGYPNAYDRAYGRTGGDIMMHGGRSSAGCYAITDEQIACTRTGVVLRESAIVPDTGLSIPHGPAESSEAPRKSKHAFLEDAEGGQRSL